MVLLIILFFVSSLGTCCKNNEWHGIKPLHSTRADVERILGKPTPDSIAKDAASYVTRDAKVSVLYSSAGCDVEPNNGWNIPYLTVLEITVYPEAGLPLSDLKVAKERFERRPDPDIIDRVEYFNDKDGVGFFVNGEGIVESIRYFPKEKDNHLRCKKRISK